MNSPADQKPLAGESWAEAWNRFWFTPASTQLPGLLRMLTGGLAVLFLLSYSWDLVAWFGADGLLTVDTAHEIYGEDLGSRLARALYGGTTDRSGASYRFSPFFHVASPAALWSLHILALSTALAMTLGIASRWTTPACLVAVLGYLHRAPLLADQFEPVLVMLLLYLSLAPTGESWTLLHWLRKTPPATVSESVWANVAIRLIQLHVAGLYAMMGLAKISGEAWRNGDAVWWLIAAPETRLLDLTFLHEHPFVYNAWTHLIVAFELAFPLAILSRRLRPYVLLWAVVHWGQIALLSGQICLALAMLAGTLAFVPFPWNTPQRQIVGFQQPGD